MIIFHDNSNDNFQDNFDDNFNDNSDDNFHDNFDDHNFHSPPRRGSNRIVLEKPFGSDFDTSKELNAQLGELFSEQDIFRMDHYLGEEMVQNILPFRFANQAFEPTWNQQHIETVEIRFKEPFGAYGRGAYFDKYGMIRDVVQNHLLQAFILVAMDEPRSLAPDDIRKAKVKLLKQVRTLEMKNVVLGQYTGNPQRPEGDEGRLGYLDDPTVPANSTTATYSLTILEVNSTRWANVPFVIRAGKALDEDLVEIRVYYKVRPNLYSLNDFSDDPRNVLVLRLRPKEEICLRLRVKRPTGGDDDDLVETRLDLNYEHKFNVSHARSWHNVVVGGGGNHKLSSPAEAVRGDALREVDPRRRAQPEGALCARPRAGGGVANIHAGVAQHRRRTSATASLRVWLEDAGRGGCVAHQDGLGVSCCLKMIKMKMMPTLVPSA